MARAPKQAKAAAPDPANELDDGKRAHPVLSPLKHDGRLYGPDVEDGATVRMTDAEAEVLIALGVLGEPEAD